MTTNFARAYFLQQVLVYNYIEIWSSECERFYTQEENGCENETSDDGNDYFEVSDSDFQI